MKCERIFAEIDALNEACIKMWQDVCNIESPTKCKEGVDAADVTAAGILCVDSIGAGGGAIHSPDEYAYLVSLAESAKRVAAVAVELE